MIDVVHLTAEQARVYAELQRIVKYFNGLSKTERQALSVSQMYPNPGDGPDLLSRIATLDKDYLRFLNIQQQLDKGNAFLESPLSNILRSDNEDFNLQEWVREFVNTQKFAEGISGETQIVSVRDKSAKNLPFAQEALAYLQKNRQLLIDDAKGSYTVQGDEASIRQHLQAFYTKKLEAITFKDLIEEQMKPDTTVSDQSQLGAIRNHLLDALVHENGFQTAMEKLNYWSHYALGVELSTVLITFSDFVTNVQKTENDVDKLIYYSQVKTAIDMHNETYRRAEAIVWLDRMNRVVGTASDQATPQLSEASSRFERAKHKAKAMNREIKTGLRPEDLTQKREDFFKNCTQFITHMREALYVNNPDVIKIILGDSKGLSDDDLAKLLSGEKIDIQSLEGQYVSITQLQRVMGNAFDTRVENRLMTDSDFKKALKALEKPGADVGVGMLEMHGEHLAKGKLNERQARTIATLKKVAERFQKLTQNEMDDLKESAFEWDHTLQAMKTMPEVYEQLLFTKEILVNALPLYNSDLTLGDILKDASYIEKYVVDNKLADAVISSKHANNIPYSGDFNLPQALDALNYLSDRALVKLDGQGGYTVDSKDAENIKNALITFYTNRIQGIKLIELTQVHASTERSEEQTKQGQTGFTRDNLVDCFLEKGCNPAFEDALEERGWLDDYRHVSHVMTLIKSIETKSESYDQNSSSDENVKRFGATFLNINKMNDTQSAVKRADQIIAYDWLERLSDEIISTEQSLQSQILETKQAPKEGKRDSFKRFFSDAASKLGVLTDEQKNSGKQAYYQSCISIIGQMMRLMANGEMDPNIALGYADTHVSSEALRSYLREQFTQAASGAGSSSGAVAKFEVETLKNMSISDVVIAMGQAFYEEAHTRDFANMLQKVDMLPADADKNKSMPSLKS